MLIVQVHVRVKPEFIDRFREITAENAVNSILEPGIARFDVIQQIDDPSRFVLIEAYRTEDAPARHKETEHYAKWRAAAEEMMAEPRTGIRYTNVAPSDESW